MSEESGKYVTKNQLLKVIPNAECCDCGLEADNYSGLYKWIIYHKKIVYCPRCAEHEGWGFEE